MKPKTGFLSKASRGFSLSLSSGLQYGRVVPQKNKGRTKDGVMPVTGSGHRGPLTVCPILCTNSGVEGGPYLAASARAAFSGEATQRGSKSTHDLAHPPPSFGSATPCRQSSQEMSTGQKWGPMSPSMMRVIGSLGPPP